MEKEKKVIIEKEQLLYKLDWDLTRFYDSADDPRIEEDTTILEQVCIEFANKYGGVELGDSTVLLIVLSDYAKLNEILAKNKPRRYLSARGWLNIFDDEVRVRGEVVDQRITKAKRVADSVLSPLLLWDDEQVKKTLDDPLLMDYHAFLRRKLEKRSEQLLPAIEELLDEHKGVFPELFRDLEISLRETKKKGIKEVEPNMVYANFARSEYVNRIRAHGLEDKLRGREKPYSFRLSQFEITENEVMEMNQVITAAYPLAHRFYRLHAQLLGKEKIKPGQRMTSVGKIELDLSPRKGVEMIKEVFAQVGRRDFVDGMFANGQIDFLPSESKSRTCFASLGPDEFSFVLGNFGSNLGSLITVVHELGHALDASLFYQHPNPLYRSHLVTMSEFPSKLMELVAEDVIRQHLTPAEEIIFLENRLNSTFNSVFFITAMFNFEVQLHQMVREGEYPSVERIAQLWLSQMKAYMGDVFEFSEKDGYNWVSIPHLRAFFCSHCYIFGDILARNMYKRYKEDFRFWSQIEQLMKTGTSKQPRESLKKLGINLDIGYWVESINSLGEEVDRLETLCRQRGLLKR